MTKPKVKRKVLRRAAKIVKATQPKEVKGATPLPVFELWYPSRGVGRMVKRYMRVVEATGDKIRGFQVDYPFDQDERGQFKEFHRAKIDGMELLYFNPV